MIIHPANVARIGATLASDIFIQPAFPNAIESALFADLAQHLAILRQHLPHAGGQCPHGKLCCIATALTLGGAQSTSCLRMSAQASLQSRYYVWIVDFARATTFVSRDLGKSSDSTFAIFPIPKTDLDAEFRDRSTRGSARAANTTGEHQSILLGP